MEAIVILTALFLVSMVINLVYHTRFKRSRQRYWKLLQELSESDDPGIRKTAAEEALFLIHMGDGSAYPTEPPKPHRITSDSSEESGRT